MATRHKHSTKHTTDYRCFTHCVAGGNCNPCAHGSITYYLICSCGARRAINTNGNHVERGPWITPETED
jgi:hypothetical protein